MLTLIHVIAGAYAAGAMLTAMCLWLHPDAPRLSARAWARTMLRWPVVLAVLDEADPGSSL